MNNKEGEHRQKSPEYYFHKDWFQINQVAENVWAPREPKHEQDVVSYFIEGKGRNIIIEGVGLANIKQALPNSDKPTSAFLSHTHWDHMGGIREFSEIVVFNNPYEINRVKRGWQPREMPGFEPENFLVPLPPTFSADTFYLPGANNFKTVGDEEKINLEDLTILVIYHTPGHTPGSIYFFIEEKGYLFTGDTLYPGPEYLHMRESNPNDYFKSLERLNSILKGKITSIFPAHNAIKASPELLENHILAAKGLLTPHSIEEKEDSFN